MMNRLLASIVGVDRMVRFLDKNGFYTPAWELLAHRFLQLLRKDPTFIYTFEFGIQELKMAKLAVKAREFEKAWQSTFDAIAVFKWKRAEEEQCYWEAQETMQDAERRIAPERLQELLERSRLAADEIYRKGELSERRDLGLKYPWVWQKVTSKLSRPRLKDRLP